MAIKLMLGGSPCTYWSIAQKNNRETEPTGLGWELFRNYLVAKQKFNPDIFLYENNKSAAQPIKDQIAQELGVGSDPQARFTYINSALVSAQNRRRFYVTNFGDIEQPEDRGILLKDILEYGFDLSQKDKSYCLTATYNGATATNTPEKKQRPMVGEPVRIGCCPSPDGTLKNSQAMRLYSIEGKSVNLTAQGGGMGAKTGLYVAPVSDNVAVFTLPHGYQQGIMSYDKSPTLTTGTAIRQQNPVIVPYQGEELGEQSYQIINKIYIVQNGQITIKDKQYPIKIQDGYYIIRKLTVTECCRLQTMPDDYCKAVSATQGYKGLGNGWTAEVIIHLLNHSLKDVPRNEELVVLSL